MGGKKKGTHPKPKAYTTLANGVQYDGRGETIQPWGGGQTGGRGGGAQTGPADGRYGYDDFGNPMPKPTPWVLGPNEIDTSWRGEGGGGWGGSYPTINFPALPAYPEYPELPEQIEQPLPDNAALLAAKKRARAKKGSGRTATLLTQKSGGLE